MSLQNKCIFQFLISIFSLRCKKTIQDLCLRDDEVEKNLLCFSNLLYEYFVYIFPFSSKFKSRKYFFYLTAD